MYTIAEFSIFLMVWSVLILLTRWYMGRYDALYLKAITPNPLAGRREQIGALLFMMFAPAYYVPTALFYTVSVIFWSIVFLGYVILVWLWLDWHDGFSPEVSRQFRDDLDKVLDF